MILSASDSTTQIDALREAFLRLDLRLRLAVDSMRTEIAERAADPLRGLYISDADVDKLLADVPPAEAARRLLSGPAGAVSPRLARLAELYSLDSFEQDALLVCFAPEVDLRYERLYGYLQDDVSRKRPTVDLVLRLLYTSEEEEIAHRKALGPGGALFSAGLLVLADDAAQRWSLLSRPLKPDDRIVEYLLGSDAIDARIALFATVERPREDSPWSFNAGIEANLARLLTAPAPERGPIITIHGQGPGSRRAAVRGAANAARQSLLLVDIDSLVAMGEVSRSLQLVLREALLQDAILALDGVDYFLGEDPAIAPTRVGLVRDLKARPGATMLLGEGRLEPTAWVHGVPGLRIELPPLTLADRAGLWGRTLSQTLGPEELTELAARYRLDGEGLAALEGAARLHAIWRDGAEPAARDIWSAARAVSAPPLEHIARRVTPRHTWDDLILPPDGLAQLQELTGRARYALKVLEDWEFGRKHAGRAGLTALFAGQPGTGKTMAAEIVAGSLGLDLYRIDLAAVVSKYIGETEKNLDRIFEAAERGDAVLLFDEADALFGKRSEVRDAHDRYANVEIAYLLQRLEIYDGVAILTTNLRGNLDEAFLRRLDFGVDFPMPEEEERLQIWRLSLPKAAPLADDVDLEFLARQFRLAGGHIRNIALTGAFLAAESGGPIAMSHLIRATRREYQKLGKLIAESDFERYYRLLKTP